MLGIVVSGHGEFAGGLEKTVEYVLGRQENMFYVNFNDGMGTKELEDKYAECIEQSVGEGILFLTDLAGGTPFSTAVNLSMKNPNIKVIGGCNMPMILSTLELREEARDIKEILENILEFSKSSIVSFQNIDINKNIELIDEDGI